MILTADRALAEKLRHITTTAKRPHPWEFFHDQVGYNYRLPNLNAALGCAQMERLPVVLANKRQTHQLYRGFFAQRDLGLLEETEDSISNYWLNALILGSREERDDFLRFSTEHGVNCRPMWRLLSDLPMFASSECTELAVSRWLADRVVNLPSSERIE